MFSFHKPKVYRSPTGCCICKAKSSSSRFTDSKKYEDDFIECFQLEERRNGEICNACVLLVKRWKKLPTGSNRNWRHMAYNLRSRAFQSELLNNNDADDYGGEPSKDEEDNVVDARAGPGIKSLTKFKSKNKKKTKDNLEKVEKILKKKHVYLKPDQYREGSPSMSDDPTEEYLAGTGSKGSSRAGSPAGSEDSDKTLNRESTPTEENKVAVHGWIDLTYFKREIICCGTIFKGPYGEVIVDPSLIKPCLGCTTRQRMQRERRANNNLGSRSHSSSSASPAPSSASTSPAHSSASASPAHSVESSSSGTEATGATKPLGKTFSDSSSDSGYDESSNQGIGESKIGKILQTSSATSNVIAVKQPQQTTVKIHPVIKSVQLNGIAVSETVRLKADLPIKLVPINQVEKLVCKPLSLAVGQSGNVTLSGSTSRPIVTAIPGNPLVDFAIHASTRQSVAN